MLGYGSLASCACACRNSPSPITSASVPSAIMAAIFSTIWFIDSSWGIKRPMHTRMDVLTESNSCLPSVTSVFPQKVRPVPHRFFQRFLSPPAANLVVVSAQQYIRNVPSAKGSRPRVVRVVEKAAASNPSFAFDRLRAGKRRVAGTSGDVRQWFDRAIRRAERFVRGGVFVSQRAGDQPHHGVHYHRGSQFTSGEHEVADGNFIGREMLRHALIDSFVASGNQQDSFEFRKPLRRLLPEQFPGGGKQHDRGPARRSSIARASLYSENRFCCLEQRFGFHHHAFAAAKGPVVDCFVPVVRMVAQIVYPRFNQAGLTRAPHDSVIERPGKKAWKNCNDVELHLRSAARCRRRVSVRQQTVIRNRGSDPAGLRAGR